MEYGKTLIDKAAKVCGSDQALAERLGTSRPNISLMRAGKRAISPVMAAELADIAGFDVNEAVSIALLESVKGTPKEGRLRNILGKGLAAGAVAMLATSYTGAANGYTAEENKRAEDLTICTLYFFRAIKIKMKKARRARFWRPALRLPSAKIAPYLS